MKRLSVLSLVVFSACFPKLAPQRLPEQTKIAVGYVVDPPYSGGATTSPQELKDAVTFELRKHNLEPVEVPLEAIAAQRLTDSRFDAVKKAADDAPFFLLVEQRVHFFSQIDGRYRWEVGNQLTAGRADGAIARDPFEIAVVLMFDHEKEKEAIVYAKDDIAKRIGVLMDGVLAGSVQSTPPVQTRPAEKPSAAP